MCWKRESAEVSKRGGGCHGIEWIGWTEAHLVEGCVRPVGDGLSFQAQIRAPVSEPRPMTC